MARKNRFLYRAKQTAEVPAMLVLSRKMGQRIFIGDNVEVVVIEIRGDRVKLGFIAPPGIPINREEVLARLEPWRHLDEPLLGRAVTARCQ